MRQVMKKGPINEGRTGAKGAKRGGKDPDPLSKAEDSERGFN